MSMHELSSGDGPKAVLSVEASDTLSSHFPTKPLIVDDSHRPTNLSPAYPMPHTAMSPVDVLAMAAEETVVMGRGSQRSPWAASGARQVPLIHRGVLQAPGLQSPVADQAQSRAQSAFREQMAGSNP